MRPLAVRSIAALALALVLCFAAEGVLAQSPQGPAGGRQGMGGRGTTMREPPAVAVIPSPMIQVQLDQLEDDLKLTKEQQPEWNRYAERVGALMDEVYRARQPAATPAGSAAEQLDALVVTARARARAIDEIADAGKRLYPLLTEAQKGLADRRMARLVGPALGLPGPSYAASRGPSPGARP